MNAEKSVRQFLRAQFRARIRRDDEGHFITSVKGKTAKVQIQNFATVEANLREQCKVVKESANAMTFSYQEGKKGPKSTITLAHVGGNDVLTMTAQ